MELFSNCFMFYIYKAGSEKQSWTITTREGQLCLWLNVSSGTVQPATPYQWPTAIRKGCFVQLNSNWASETAVLYGGGPLVGVAVSELISGDDTAVSSRETQYTHSRRTVNNVIKLLRDVGTEEVVKLPKIAVIGNQSLEKLPD